MNRMKIALLALAGTAALGALTLSIPSDAHDTLHGADHAAHGMKSDEGTATGAAIGGSFDLVDEDGKPFTDKNLLGKYALVYFGFTNCPDVCPNDMKKIADTLKLTDKDRAAKLLPVFITVDPERDDPKTVKTYTDLFDDRIVGLTGKENNLRAVRDGYKVYAAKADQPDGTHMMNHSAYIYLMGPDGKFIDIFDPSESAPDIAKQLKGFIPG